jgi:Ca-activated chloride channel homolog
MSFNKTLFFLLFFPVLLLGQGTFSVHKKKFETGSHEKFSGIMDSVKITNTSNEKIHIFVTTTSKEINYRLPKRGIGVNNSDYLVFISHPKKTGSFNQHLNVFSHNGQKSIKVEITGRIRSFDQHYDEICPTFDNPNRQQALQVSAQIKVIDKVTQLPIDGAQVILSKSQKEKFLTTDRNGLVKILIRLGLYRVVTNAPGYLSKDIDHYFNRNNGSITIQLLRDKEQLEDLPLIEDRIEKQEEIIVKKEPVTIIKQEEEERKVSENFIKPEEKQEEEDQVIETVIIDDPSTFTKGIYKRNNLIFLIDVSNSMGLNKRLEKVKESMYHLIDLLRPEDYITIITYQQITDVMMDRVSATNKDSLKLAIYGLTPHGSTKGKKAVNKAYEQAKTHRIVDGNNQIILATDGGFDGLGKSQFKLLSYVRFQRIMTGTNFSVLCFGFNRQGKELLRQLCIAAGGKFYEVEKDENVVELLEKDVRRNSLIKTKK